VIGPIAAWWLASTVAGAAALPLAWRLFDRLPDRGMGLSRALGVLIGGYSLWLGSSAGWIRNAPSGAVAAMLVVAIAGWIAGRGRWREIAVWLRQHLRTMLILEALFLLAYVAWAIVRAHNPEIVATEKPMELAFLNAILRSPQFPPTDPWLSGYAISYYYLGYVLLAWLTWLTGVSGGVAFNLGNALWFGLVASGAYSLVFNLLAVRFGTRRHLAALLGPLLVVTVGNLAGVFEVMHSLHWFWDRQPDGTMTSTFWTWLNLDDLTAPPSGEPRFPPDRFWFWWQGARVISDVDLAGRRVEVIDEFPFFSFLLADNHPHVLALPFGLLALANALQVFLTPRAGGFRLRWFELADRTWSAGLRIVVDLVVVVAVGRAAGLALSGSLATEVAGALVRTLLLGALAAAGIAVVAALLSGRETSALSGRELLLVGWVSGCLAFLNTWDLPIYLSLILAAAGWHMLPGGWRATARSLGASGATVLAVGGASILLWLPTFSSQAGGILPNLIFPTRLPQFLIMFAVPLVPIAAWLALRVRRELRGAGGWRLALGVTLGVPLGMLALSWLLGGLIAAMAAERVPEALAGMGASSLTEAAASAFARRIDAPSVALLLSLMLALAWLYLRAARSPASPPTGAASPGAAEVARGVGVFVVLMFALGAALILVPEYFYLRDSFGSRMNTVFKLYYGAWVLWAVGAAYALAWPWETFGRAGRAALAAAVVPLALGLVYTATALWEKTSHFNPATGRTLDGTAHLDFDDPSDAAAIRWMRAALEPGVVAEAVGGSYTSYGRVSAHTGFPTVLGWPFHEYQWRGDFAPQGSRAEDIDRLYRTRDWDEARAILDRYGIRYVYIGLLERTTYDPVITRKFDVFMEKLYDQNDVTIYGRRTEAGS